jgi:hypothetical protein
MCESLGSIPVMWKEGREEEREKEREEWAGQERGRKKEGRKEGREEKIHFSSRGMVADMP